MKFKKYVKESFNNNFNDAAMSEETFNTETLEEGLTDKLVIPFIKKYGVSTTTQQAWEQELEELSANIAAGGISDAQIKSLKDREATLKQLFDAQREFEATHKKNESLSDMDRRCETCNTLLNDNGTCPKCDDGEEDYGDEVKSKSCEHCFNEDLSVREKLKAAYPELNFDTPVMTEACVTEDLSNKEKLIKAFPGVFDFEATESVTEELDDYSEYDDDYTMDDVQIDRRHAALYGGDRMYCDCGHKLSYNEYGSYCPRCTPKDFDSDYNQ